MAERSVHEAAVEAMKRATCVCETGINGRHWNACPAPAMPEAIAALVASAEVREGLVRVFADHVCPSSEECIDGRVARRRAATVLAALGGTGVAG